MRIVFQEAFNRALASHNDSISLTNSSSYNKNLCFSLSPKLDKIAESFYYIINAVSDNQEDWKHKDYLSSIDTIASLFILGKNLPHIVIEPSLKALIEAFIDNITKNWALYDNLQRFMGGDIEFLEKALLADNSRITMILLSTWIFTIDNHIDDNKVIEALITNKPELGIIEDIYMVRQS